MLTKLEVVRNKRIYRIGNSKEPTLEILKRIAYNLQATLKVYATVRVDAWCHREEEPYVKYWLGLDDPYRSDGYETWPEVLAVYRKLMKEAKDEI